MNKRIVLSVVLVLCLLLSMASFVSADDGFKLNARVTEWSDNNEFELIVSVENNPGLAGFGFSVEFDGMLIKPIEIKPLELIEGRSSLSNLDEYKSGVTKVLNIGCFSTYNFIDDGDIYSVRFGVSEYASAVNSAQNVEIKLVENPKGLFYNQDIVEFIPVYGSTSVVLPSIEGDGETFVSETEEEQEVIDEGNEVVITPTEPDDSTTEEYDTIIILTINSVEIKVNDNTLINDVAPIIVNDRTMLPIRVIAQELGVSRDNILWDEAEQKVTVITDEKKIEVFINSADAYVNGEKVVLDSPAFIQNDRTYLPIRFVSENLGADVQWNGELQQVTVTK